MVRVRVSINHCFGQEWFYPYSQPLKTVKTGKPLFFMFFMFSEGAKSGRKVPSFPKRDVIKPVRTVQEKRGFHCTGQENHEKTVKTGSESAFFDKTGPSC